MVRFRTVVLSSVASVLAGCTTMTTQVRARAARDLACSKADTRIVDAEAGVYRLTGCGFAAGYECRESPALDVRCQQLYVNKLDEGPTPKREGAERQAKSP